MISLSPPLWNRPEPVPGTARCEWWFWFQYSSPLLKGGGGYGNRNYHAPDRAGRVVLEQVVPGTDRNLEPKPCNRTSRHRDTSGGAR